VINLFVWPNKGGKDEPVQRFARRGYCAYRWSTEGMNYRAVSDVNEPI
jgi:anti-sigma factor RsiW